MSQAETPSRQEKHPTDGTKYRQQLFVGHSVAAALFGILAGFLFYKFRGDAARLDYLWVGAWSAILALLALMAVLWMRLAEPGQVLPRSENDALAGLEDTRI